MQHASTFLWGKKSNRAYRESRLASRDEHKPMNSQKYNARCKTLLSMKVSPAPWQGVCNSTNPFCSCIVAGSTQTS